MTENEKYILEYWLDSEEFTREKLISHFESKLAKYLADIEYTIDANNEKYLILEIISTEKIIDSCHDKLKFDREWAFRSKDELGNKLRSEAYPILAEIEICIRNFINKSMTEILGVNWWQFFQAEKIKKRVKDIESRSNQKQIAIHHPIEYTFFEDLIKIVTHEFQGWPDNKSISTSDLLELFSDCNDIEDIKEKISGHRKIVSFWDDVFSDYFEDKGSWAQLKKNMDSEIIPIRNKVMHHRVMRKFELSALVKYRDDLVEIIGEAKNELAENDLQTIQNNIKIIGDTLKPILDVQALKSAAFMFPTFDLAAASIPTHDIDEMNRVAARAMSIIDLDVLKNAAAVLPSIAELDTFKELATSFPTPDLDAFKALARPFNDLDMGMFKTLENSRAIIEGDKSDAPIDHEDTSKNDDTQKDDDIDDECEPDPVVDK